MAGSNAMVHIFVYRIYVEWQDPGQLVAAITITTTGKDPYDLPAVLATDLPKNPSISVKS
jgi:hypothetical protein